MNECKYQLFVETRCQANVFRLVDQKEEFGKLNNQLGSVSSGVEELLARVSGWLPIFPSPLPRGGTIV